MTWISFLAHYNTKVKGYKMFGGRRTILLLKQISVNLWWLKGCKRHCRLFHIQDDTRRFVIAFKYTHIAAFRPVRSNENVQYNKPTPLITEFNWYHYLEKWWIYTFVSLRCNYSSVSELRGRVTHIWVRKLRHNRFRWLRIAVWRHVII